jgi:hypothetical protein
MNTQETPTLTTLARAMIAVEWQFLRVALAILVGILPFTLAAINTSGKVIAAAWGVFYIGCLVATTRVYAGFIMDGLRVAFGREPRFWPSAEREWRDKKDKIVQARAVMPKPSLLLLDVTQFMNPLSLTATIAGVYVMVKHPSVSTPAPLRDPHLGRAEVMAYDETRRVTNDLQLQPTG